MAEDADQAATEAVGEIFRGIDERFDALEGILMAVNDLVGARAFLIDNLPGPEDPAFAIIRRWERRVADAQLRHLDRCLNRFTDHSPTFLGAYRGIRDDFERAGKA